MIGHIRELHLSQVVSAIGGLGTAAFGLVDACKGIFRFVNRVGLKHIKHTIISLTPGQTGEGLPPDPLNTLRRKNILETVEANWVNGVDTGIQKAAAKSLIVLYLSSGNADALAKKTNVDADLLKSIAAKTLAGTTLLPAEAVIQSRFDLILKSLLDEAYELSDQMYRNATRALAALVAILLAFAGGWVLEGSTFWSGHEVLLALLVGVLATPLAPIAKDVSSAISTAADALQAMNKPPAPAPGAPHAP